LHRTLGICLLAIQASQSLAHHTPGRERKKDLFVAVVVHKNPPGLKTVLHSAVSIYIRTRSYAKPSTHEFILTPHTRGHNISLSLLLKTLRYTLQQSFVFELEHLGENSM
jgi:hypothetical protein